MSAAPTIPRSPRRTSSTSLKAPRAVALDILANDSDPDGNPLIIFSKTAALHGTVTITGNGTGLTYDPSGNYHGSDKFKYTITDGNGGFSTATVLITVDPDTTDPVVVAPKQAFLGQTVGSSTTKVRVSLERHRCRVRRRELQAPGEHRRPLLQDRHAREEHLDLGRSLAHDRPQLPLPRAGDRQGRQRQLVRLWPDDHPEALLAGEQHRGVCRVVEEDDDVEGARRERSLRHLDHRRSATFVFTGYDVGWIATRATSSGKAQILVDGVLVKTLDLDTSKTAYRKLVFPRHFADPRRAHAADPARRRRSRGHRRLRHPEVIPGARRIRSCYNARALSGRP